ncbi:MAG TPA: exosortase/archaeosortase family protein [Acidobacteriota bacterium]|nr:exosortase/archaeosortase family protein [Acidobacteriota bacterium]
MDFDNMNGRLSGETLNLKIATALALLLVCFGILYRPIIGELAQDWLHDDNCSHGFLIVPLALYFAWERRLKFVLAKQRPSSTGAVLFAPAILAAALNMHPFVNRIAMLLCVVGAVVFLCGWARLKVMFFPIAFLLLMIPIPAVIFNPLTFPLQLLASRFGELVLVACRVPVLREGNIMQLANTSLEVAEACSGIRSLISLLTLAIVYGYFVESRIWVRIALAIAAVPVAIASNAIRVAGTGLAAHFYGAEAAEGFFHSFSGWLVFIVAFVLLFALHRVLLLFLAARKAAEGAMESP